MSELQLGLLAIGAAVVAGVFFYNKWQERRYRREVQAGFTSRHDDVLMGLKGSAEQADQAFSSDYADPALGSLDGQAGAAGDSGRSLSELLDFVIPIETPEEVPGAAVLGAAVLTSVLPEGIQRFLFHEPVTIVVLVVGTAFVLWRVATRPPPAA